MSGLPSAWITRFAPLIPSGRVLDVACGSGRHLRWLAEHDIEEKWQIVGIDVDAAAIESIASTVPRAQAIQADLETAEWPFAPHCLSGIVVANYLWRPRWAAMLASLAPGGVYLHETFAEGHEAIGRPTRRDFLLERGELLSVCAQFGLSVIAFEDGYEPPSASHGERCVQRVCAVRPLSSAAKASRRIG
jgi:SAM-dependent methyltransferase